MDIRIGFSQEDITPEPGIELGGYAGYRPNTGVHDPLCARAVVMEQDGLRYALVTLDLLCVDEPLYHGVAQAVADLGISGERLIVAAIHSHAAPLGVLPGEGILGELNCTDIGDRDRFRAYMDGVIRAAARACAKAVETRDHFRVRWGRCPMPPIGSERHTAQPARGWLTALQFRTAAGKTLLAYSLPCHPTVLSAANTEVSADFVGAIPAYLEGDMILFFNGAAGDISTRFTRRAATFEECHRLGRMAAEAIQKCLEGQEFHQPTPLTGQQFRVTLDTRSVESEQEARIRLERLTEQWQAAVSAGQDPATVRLLKAQVEGAGVNLEFSRNLSGIPTLSLPVTVFRFQGLAFFTVPGELFSTLVPPGETVAICYANGYYRYIADRQAYQRGDYEALAAVLAPGEGEKLRHEMTEMLASIK